MCGNKNKRTKTKIGYLCETLTRQTHKKNSFLSIQAAVINSDFTIFLHHEKKYVYHLCLIMKLFLSYHIKRSVCTEQKLVSFIDCVPVSCQLYSGCFIHQFNSLFLTHSPFTKSLWLSVTGAILNMAWIFCLIYVRFMVFINNDKFKGVLFPFSSLPIRLPQKIKKSISCKYLKLYVVIARAFEDCKTENDTRLFVDD